jgi:cell cycle checkpoint protein
MLVQYLQANPHRFHLITLGTMHALPSPVPRRGQRAYKPEFFDALSRQRDAEHGVEDTLRWFWQVCLCVDLSLFM